MPKAENEKLNRTGKGGRRERKLNYIPTLSAKRYRLWEADPLLCPKCQAEMRIVALIDDREVIERILRHLSLWEQGVRGAPARAPSAIAERVVEPCYDDPFPGYDQAGDDVRERLSARRPSS